MAYGEESSLDPSPWYSAPQALTLHSDEVHVWRAPLVPTDNARAALSPADWLRAKRFHFEEDRERFIAGRGVQRQVLAQYLGLEASEVEFTAGPHGKPEFVDDTT